MKRLRAVIFIKFLKILNFSSVAFAIDTSNSPVLVVEAIFPRIDIEYVY